MDSGAPLDASRGDSLRGFFEYKNVLRLGTAVVAAVSAAIRIEEGTRLTCWRSRPS